MNLGGGNVGRGSRIRPGTESAGGGSRGHCMGSQPHQPSETTLLAEAQEFIRVSESPRAFLGHSSERAEEGNGGGCELQFQIVTHLGNIFTSSLLS